MARVGRAIPRKSLLGRWCGSAGERAEQAAEDAAIGVGCDGQMDRVRVDNQPEQVEMDRPEREVEDVTDARRGNAHTSSTLTGMRREYGGI